MRDKITKKTTLGEIVSKCPESIDLLGYYGLHCISCHVSTWETLEQGALAHGINRKKIDKIIRELNNLIKNKKEALK